MSRLEGGHVRCSQVSLCVYGRYGRLSVGNFRHANEIRTQRPPAAPPPHLWPNLSYEGHLGSNRNVVTKGGDRIEPGMWLRLLGVG